MQRQFPQYRPSLLLVLFFVTTLLCGQADKPEAAKAQTWEAAADNEATTKPRSSERQLIRPATESETVVYSIKLARGLAPLALGMPSWLDGERTVAKVTLETGGEIIDVPDDEEG
jgi:hypothetical protein